jgi:hypothetical protein
MKPEPARRLLLSALSGLLLVCCVTGAWTVERLERRPQSTYPTRLVFPMPAEDVSRCTERTPAYWSEEASGAYLGDGRRLRHDVQLHFEVSPLAEARTAVSARVVSSKVLTHSGGQTPCLGHPVPAGTAGYTDVPPTTAHEYRALLDIGRCLGADVRGLPPEPIPVGEAVVLPSREAAK